MSASDPISRTVYEVADAFAGGTPDRSNPAHFGGSIPWVKSGEVAGPPITETEETLTLEGLRSSSAKWCPAQASLVAMYGATAGQVGRLAIRATTNQAVLCVVAKDQAEADFLYYALSAAVPSLLRQLQGSGQPNLNAAMIKKLALPWPDTQTRLYVAQLLGRVDQHFDVIRQLLATKRKHKHGVMDELLRGRRRFPEFGAPAGGRADNLLPHGWREVRLGDYAEELSTRNAGSFGHRDVMGVIKGVGLEPMREHVRAADLSRYKVVPSDAFAYNPMRLNIGSLARNTSGRACLVSPDYVVFRSDEQALLPEYLDQLRRSHIWSRFIRPAGSGSVRVRIYFRDLAHMKIPLPCAAEQSRIASVLEAMDYEIRILEGVATLTADLKRAVMQKLLLNEISISSPMIAGEPINA